MPLTLNAKFQGNEVRFGKLGRDLGDTSIEVIGHVFQTKFYIYLHILSTPEILLSANVFFNIFFFL